MPMLFMIMHRISPFFFRFEAKYEVSELILFEFTLLQVVKKSAAHQESGSAMAWPRMFRGSAFPSARFSRHPFPRGIPGAFRPRPPIKLGARSLQWKRDAQGSDSSSSMNTGSVASPAAPAARGFTYVRTESKPESSLGTT